jgi:hypothetical protein
MFVSWSWLVFEYTIVYASIWREEVKRNLFFYAKTLSVVILAFSFACVQIWAADKPADTAEKKAGDESAGVVEKKVEKKIAIEEKKVEAAKESSAQTREENSEPRSNRKSPVKAGGLAIFPGVLVHGSGHMYAGSWMKGLGLATVEAASIIIGVGQYTANVDEVNKIIKGMEKNQIPTDLSNAYTAVGVMAVCSMAFLWSWFDDMTGAPVAAIRYNEKAALEERAELRLLPTSDQAGAMVALTRRF